MFRFSIIKGHSFKISIDILIYKWLVTNDDNLCHSWDLGNIFGAKRGKFIASSKVFILFNIRCTLGGVSEYFAISHSNYVTALIATTQYYAKIVHPFNWKGNLAFRG